MKKDELTAPKRHSARVQRILKKREPQVFESVKKSLIMKGHHTSQTIIDVLLDLSYMNKPNCTVLSRKNEILPFEDVNSIEFLGDKNGCSLFALGSHSKKRPNNLVMGRTFDGHILDMIEFGVDSHTTISKITGPKKAIGSKPLMVFNGSQWNTDSIFTRIQNFLIDFFRGTKLEKISLQGMDHVIVCTLIDGKIYLRTYIVNFKKSGTKIPNVHLEEMGPHFDLTLRRNQLASDDMWKVACKQPASAKEKKVKNISKTSLGDKVGRIHMQRQNLDKMGGRRSTALRGERPLKSPRSSSDGDQGEGTPDRGKKRRPSPAEE